MYRYITQLVSKARTFLMTHESRRFVPLLLPLRRCVTGAGTIYRYLV